MPRKPQTIIRSPDGDEQSAPAPPHQGLDAEELSPDVERVLGELGENASSVIVYRMKDAKPGEWDYVTRVPAPEFSTEYLKEQFGGGDYKIIIIDARHGALNPVFTSIDKRFVGKLFATFPPPLTVNNADPFKERLLEILLAKALTPPPPPPPPAPALDAKTVLEIAALFRNDGGNITDQVASLMTVATNLASAMNPPDGLASVATQFLPVLERIVPPRNAPPPRRLAAPNSPPPPVSPVATYSRAPDAPSSAPVATVQPPAHVAGTIVPKWLAPFKSLASLLVSFADQEADPTVYADVAIDRMQGDDAVFAAAVEAMNETRLLSDLYAFSPALQETERRKTFAAELVARVEEGLRELIASERGDDNTEPDAVTHG